MKKITIFLLSVFSFGIVFAQTNSANIVPAAAKSKLQEKYPEAKTVSWKESSQGFVEANFTLNKQKCNATFSTAGDWVSTDFTITKEEFPQAASSYLANVSYTNNVTRYYRTDAKDKGTQYAADAKINDHMYTFTFDKDGKFVMRGIKK